jgi:hypothetical protein
MLLLVLASPVPLASESRGTHEDILLSPFFRFLQPAGPGPRIYIPQEQDSPVLPRSIGLLSIDVKLKLKLKLNYDSQSVGQPILVSGHRQGS